ncbi:nucleoside monophosphate kinase [Candidatus Saccharibacteria bacterium]|nr:nucleoside monophosphate kinase [Candidatus Saccharibacteria bacterium]
MEEKIAAIKNWLGTGSINLFGMPMSGKDTVGIRLAEDLGAKFLSSGLLIRAVEKSENRDLTASGKLIPTEEFYDIVLPYFQREDLKPFPLVLSSVGRWKGEENTVMSAAEAAEHPIKVVVALNISESDVMERWRTAQALGDRGDRPDDNKIEVFQTRIDEFKSKTLPVLMHYQQLGMLVSVQADMSRDEVYQAVVEALYQRTLGKN